MKLLFTWVDAAGSLTPNCVSTVVNSEGVSLLACLLMDDGGLGHVASVGWLNEAISWISGMNKDEGRQKQWEREDWGARQKDGCIEIYSMHDESYTETVSIPTFLRAIQEWKDFLLLPPDTGKSKEVDV